VKKSLFPLRLVCWNTIFSGVSEDGRVPDDDFFTALFALVTMFCFSGKYDGKSWQSAQVF
jgi:hypothetical protein